MGTGIDFIQWVRAMPACPLLLINRLIDVRMPVFFSVNLYVDITEQEQKNHKKFVSFSLSNEILHTLFFAISHLRLFLSDDNSSAKEENV